MNGLCQYRCIAKEKVTATQNELENVKLRLDGAMHARGSEADYYRAVIRDLARKAAKPGELQWIDYHYGMGSEMFIAFTADGDLYHISETPAWDAALLKNWVVVHHKDYNETSVVAGTIIAKAVEWLIVAEQLALDHYLANMAKKESPNG